MEKQFILYKAQDHHFDGRHYLGEVINHSVNGAWVKTPSAAEPPQFVEAGRVVSAFAEHMLLSTITRFWNHHPGKRLVSFLN